MPENYTQKRSRVIYEPVEHRVVGAKFQQACLPAFVTAALWGNDRMRPPFLPLPSPHPHAQALNGLFRPQQLWRVVMICQVKTIVSIVERCA